MPDLKQLIKEAAAQGATKEQLDVIYNAYQDNVKKKAQPTASLTGGFGLQLGFPTSQPTKAYVPAPLIGQGVEDYQKEQAKKQAAAERLSNKLKTQQAAYYAGQGEKGFIDVENAKLQSDYNQLQAVIQKDLGNKGSDLGITYNKLLQGTGSVISGAIDAGLNALKYSPHFPGVVTDANILEYRTNIAPEVKNFLKETIGADADKGAERKYDENFITGTIGGLAYSVPAMVTPFGIGLYSQAYDSGLDLINSTPAGNELTEAEKTLFAVGLGSVVGRLEKVGLNRILGRTASSELVNGLTFKAINNLSKTGGKITAEAIGDFAENALRKTKNKLLNSADQGYRAFLDEFTTGSLQEGATIGAEQVVNKLKNKDIFDTQNMGEMFGRVLKSGAAEGFGGSIIGAGKGGLMVNTKNHIVDKISNARSFDDVRNLLLDIEKIGEENNYSPEEIEEVVNTVNDIAQKREKLPQDLTPAQATGIVNLMVDRDELTDNLKELEVELNNTDDALKPAKVGDIELAKKRVSAINAKIAEIAQNPNYAIQKPSTASQVPPVIEGGQIVQEGGEGVGQSIQGTEAPQAIIPQEKAELKDVKSTSDFIRSNDLSYDISQKVDQFFIPREGKDINDTISEEYHRAKLDGSNPNLVRVVEESVPEVAVKETITQAPQVITQEEVVSKGLPKATSNFEAVEVIDYNKPEINKYRPSEQLKFNQGTYESVRLVGDEDLIKFIQAGSERSIKLDGRVKKANKISQQFVDKKQKEFGITAIEAYERAKEIAKANRDKNTERIVVLGDKISAQATTPQVSQVASEEQARLHNQEGGSTFTVDGTNRNGTKAASVSIFPERTKIVEGELTKEDIDTYVKENSDIYSGNGDVLAVGTWFNSETGETYLDVSVVLPKKEAKRLGKDYNQIAVWDLEKGREIPTGGTGEAIEGLKPEIDRVSDVRAILGQQKALKQAEVKVEEKAPAKPKEIYSEKRAIVDEINNESIKQFGELMLPSIDNPLLEVKMSDEVEKRKEKDCKSNRCETNVFDFVKKNPDRYAPVGGYMVTNSNFPIEHWWVYDRKTGKQIDITPLGEEGKDIKAYIGVIGDAVSNEVKDAKIIWDVDFFKGGNVQSKVLDKIINGEDVSDIIGDRNISASKVSKYIPSKKTKELANLVKEGKIDEFLKEINNIGDVEFSTKIVENIQDQSFDAIVDEINQLGDTKVAFNIDDEISDGGTIDIEGVQEREGLAKKPKYVKISDFAGKPIMLTISDQLSSGNTVNPFTGNPVEDLNGGLFFNYTKGNTESGWAYTDLDTANDVLNIAKELYNNNPQLYPDGIVPTAVVKMGEDSITSNEAIARVLSDNLKTFPEANKKAAFKAIKIEVKRLLDASVKNVKEAESAGKLNKNAVKDSKIYSNILDYLNRFNTLDEAVDYNNIKTLPIATRPYLIKRFTVGEPRVNLPKITKGAIKTDIAKALLNGLPTDMVKGIHLAYVTNTVSEKALDNVPSRHIMAFVGIDAKADAPIKSNHPNYPYALKGKGLGIVKNTKHLASVFPQAYGNTISKYLSGKAETPSKAVSQAIFGGLKDVLYRNKSLNLSNDNVAKLIGFMNVSFPSVRFMSDANSWNDIISSENVQKHIVNGETIYGLTTNGDIYLNPDFKDLNTPIHEMGHIWIDFVQTTNQKLYNKGLSLVDNTPEFEASKKVYGNTDKARKEALAILIGNNGETIANASQKSKFKKWLLGMWEYLQTKFPSLRDLSVKQIENLTLDQFIGGALRDIVGGKEITKDLSALKMSDQFRGEVNFKSVKADAVDVLSRMLKSKLITQEQYESAMERVGATTSIKNAEVEAKRAEYGFEEPSKRPYQSNKTTLDMAKQAIKDGASVNDVIERALNREPITDVESAMLSLYQGTKEAELLKANSELEKMQSSSALDFTEAVDKRNKIIDDLVNAYNAGEVSGNVSARALQARKIKVLQDDSLANMLIQKRKANNNRKLTNKQVEEITQLYTKMKATKALLEIKIEKLNEENAKLKLKNAAPKIVSEVKTESTGKTKEQLKAEREDIFKQMSELARKSRANLSMNPIPAEMIPLVVKLAKNYLATGAKTLDEVIDKVQADLSGYIENVSKNDIRRTLADYDNDNRPTKEDIQDKVFGERSKEKQIKDIEDLENQAKKEKDPEAAQLLLDEANAKRAAMEKQAEKDGLDKEQSRLDNYKKNIQKRIDELQGKLKKGDYSKTPKNEIKLDDEARKLKKQLEDIKFQFAVELEKDALKSRNQLEKAVDVVVEVSNTPRALMATADFSAPLRQAAVSTVAYPDIAAKAANEMMVQWASSEKAEQWMDDLIESPGYKLMKDSGLYIANIRSAKLSAKEEDFATNLASKIPGAGKLVDASERAYVAYLNKMRVDIFNQGVELLQNDGYSFATDPKAYKTLANYVNAVTGRGSLGGGALEKAGPALNALMFSPRLLASRVRLLTMLADPRIYKKENRVVRNMYLKDMSRFVGFGLTVLALAALAGADVEDDPRSTDFGKIKVGDTRWDIWGGFQQPIRAFVQATLEERKSTTTGKIVKLDGSGYGGETGGDVVLRFFRGKLAPVPAFAVNAYTGKDVMGRPFELGPSLLQMSYPLVIQSVVESAKKDGIVFGVLATGVPSLLGIGVQTYGANDFLKQGVDDKSINLLLSKKAIAIEPNELDTKVFDVNTGEDRKMTDEEFKKYYQDWADYIKMKLNDNYDEYKDMSVDDFETEFRAIKSEATKLAKEEISGVSNTTKTISYREDDESESYKLTPEELKYRQSLNEQYISRHGNVYNKEFKDAIRSGKSPEEAAIIANKRLTSKANAYSRKIILKQHKRGRGYDF